MPKAPDGAIMDESSSDDGTITPAGEAEKEAGKREDKPKPNRWCGCPSMQGMPSPFPRSHR